MLLNEMNIILILPLNKNINYVLKINYRKKYSKCLLQKNFNHFY